MLKKKSGDTVTISTRGREDCYEITITDDGIGFDPSAPLAEPGAHIGIKNVRERLRSMCGRALKMDREVGQGATATMRIPKVDGFGFGEEALAFGRENPCEVAFLDIDMSDMDGITLAKHLKQVNPKINIIFVTIYKNILGIP